MEQKYCIANGYPYNAKVSHPILPTMTEHWGGCVDFQFGEEEGRKRRGGGGQMFEN